MDAGYECADEVDVRLSVDTVLGKPARKGGFGESAEAGLAEERVLCSGIEGLRDR